MLCYISCLIKYNYHSRLKYVPHGDIYAGAFGVMRLTLPYLACQAKKYRRAPSGWPTRQKLTQKMQLPITLPDGPRIFSNGVVSAIKGSWNIIPKKATPATQLAKQGE